MTKKKRSFAPCEKTALKRDKEVCVPRKNGLKEIKRFAPRERTALVLSQLCAPRKDGFGLSQLCAPRKDGFGLGQLCAPRKDGFKEIKSLHLA